jgi:hypothetical protein
VSKLVSVNLGEDGVLFAGIERDDGTRIVADYYMPTGNSFPLETPSGVVLLVDPEAFELERVAAGLQPVWR